MVLWWRGAICRCDPNATTPPCGADPLPPAWLGFGVRRCTLLHHPPFDLLLHTWRHADTVESRKAQGSLQCLSCEEEEMRCETAVDETPSLLSERPANHRVLDVILGRTTIMLIMSKEKCEL